MNADITNQQMEEIYRTLAVEDIPWNREAPPDLLVELVETGRLKPGRVIDIGCGTGVYSRYLATQGFEVTGVDASETAIRIAREKAAAASSAVDYKVADVTSDVSSLPGPFDLVHEWMILHHILPVDRDQYLANLLELLKPGGRYLSVSFSLADRNFGDPPGGRFRRSPLGPIVYFASLEELEKSFKSHFRIIDARITHIPGKKGEHTVNYLFLERR